MAGTFDATGKGGAKLTFELRLTVGLAARIKKALAVDLNKLLDEPKTFTSMLFAEPETLVRLLWMFCADQAAAKNITEEDFGELFDGDVLEAAVAAVMEAVVDFFPKARGRDEIRKGLPRAMEKMEQAANHTVRKHLDRFLNLPVETFLKRAGDSQDSSALTPEG